MLSRVPALTYPCLLIACIFVLIGQSFAIRNSLKTTVVTAPAIDVESIQARLLPAGVSVLAGPPASETTATIDGRSVVGYAQIEAALNHKLVRSQQLTKGILFGLALLSIFAIVRSSATARQGLLPILFLASPVAVIAAATRVCRECAPGGSDWLAVAVTFVASGLVALLLVRTVRPSSSLLLFLQLTCLAMLVGQLALLIDEPKFCPICLFAGGMLITLLAKVQDSLSEREVTGIGFASARPAFAVVIVGLIGGAATYAQSPGAMVGKKTSIEAVRKALSATPLPKRGVILLARHGCEPCDQALALLKTEGISLKTMYDGSPSEATWDGSMPVLTPTFAFIEDGKVTEYLAGLPREMDARQELITNLRKRLP